MNLMKLHITMNVTIRIKPFVLNNPLKFLVRVETKEERRSIKRERSHS